MEKVSIFALITWWIEQVNGGLLDVTSTVCLKSPGSVTECSLLPQLSMVTQYSTDCCTGPGSTATCSMMTQG